MRLQKLIDNGIENGNIAAISLQNTLSDLRKSETLAELNTYKHKLCGFIDGLEFAEAITYSETLLLLEEINSIYENIKEQIFNKILFE